MFFSYVKLALRLLLRNPVFAVVNILGLSIGFAIFLILWQYTQSELKSEHFRKDYKQIYRACFKTAWTDVHGVLNEASFGLTPYILDHTIAKYTDIEDFAFFVSQDAFNEKMTQGHGKDVFFANSENAHKLASFVEDKVVYATPNFFHFFSIPITRGDEKQPLALAPSITISEATAQKYFGLKDPVGMTLLLNNSIALKVTAVFKDLPTNTHLNFDIVMSTERIKYGMEHNYLSFPTKANCYYKFPKSTSVKEMQAKANAQSKVEIQALFWGNDPEPKAEVFFQPLSDVVFEGFRYSNYVPKSRSMLVILAIASQVILFMGWANFINLTVAKNSKRMKELAARKTVGATPKDFIIQFAIESLIVNIISITLAVTFVQLFKSWAVVLFQFTIPDLKFITAGTYYTLAAVLALGITLTSIYPALIAIKETPRGLFGAMRSKIKQGTFPWVLTTLQFSTSIALIVWIFAVNLQVNFLLDRSIGLNKEQVIVVDLPFVATTNFRQDISVFLQRISSMRGIGGSTVSNSMAADKSSDISLATGTGDVGTLVDTNGGVDENFLPFYGIRLIEGRNFGPENPSNRNGLLISRRAMHDLGIKDPKEAIGKILRTRTFRSPDETEGVIIGVFEDYELRPLLNQSDANFGDKRGIALTYKDFLLPRLNPRNVSVRVTNQDSRATIQGIEGIYRSIFPGQAFSWYFLDDQINNRYQSDLTSRNQITFFTMLAIGISCLGLFGMMMNQAEIKVREIGIRKVLGAQLFHIAWILLKTTMGQIALSCMVGVPLAVYLTRIYFLRFSEHIDLQWWHFTLPPLLLLLLLLSTVATVILKAFTNNPVAALKCE